MASALAGTAHAQTSGSADTRLRLDQERDRQSAEAERQLLKDAEDLGGVPSTIEIDGKAYAVAKTPGAIGEALYVAIARRQWADVQRFLKAYLAFAERDPMLVAYARGALARIAGKLGEAERQYRVLLALQPDFVPGQLELARVLFENHKDREARRMFETALAALAGEGDKAAGVRRTIDSFTQALGKRRGWQGSVAIGPGYSSNLNQSSGSYTCLLATDDGTCLIDRKVPDPIKAMGINFESNVSRRIPLRGHSGITGRALFYGDIYPGHGRYSQTTLTTQLGYDHRTARASFTLSPSFDMGSLGSDILYDAIGIRAETMVNPSATSAIRIEASRRWFNYRLPSYRNFDGALTEMLLTGWKVLPQGWTLFAGPDFAAKEADDPVNAHRQYGLRLGVNKQFGQAVSLLAFASFRQRDYRAYSELLEAKRRDREQNYIANIRIPALRLANLTPSLLLQHSRIRSNVDWLYSYRKTSVAVRMDYAF
jgi:thioredoxin-like negative regulator of GroEL